MSGRPDYLYRPLNRPPQLPGEFSFKQYLKDNWPELSLWAAAGAGVCVIIVLVFSLYDNYHQALVDRDAAVARAVVAEKKLVEMVAAGDGGILIGTIYPDIAPAEIRVIPTRNKKKR